MVIQSSVMRVLVYLFFNSILSPEEDLPALLQVSHCQHLMTSLFSSHIQDFFSFGKQESLLYYILIISY